MSMASVSLQPAADGLPPPANTTLSPSVVATPPACVWLTGAVVHVELPTSNTAAVVLPAAVPTMTRRSLAATIFVTSSNGEASFVQFPVVLSYRSTDHSPGVDPVCSMNTTCHPTVHAVSGANSSTRDGFTCGCTLETNVPAPRESCARDHEPSLLS